MTSLQKNSEHEHSAALSQSQPLRLGFLDGIRGLAALTVLGFHLGRGVVFWLPFYGAQEHIDVSRAMHLVILFNFVFLGFGREAVVVFIVLSGYCLMLPVARHPQGQLKGGTREFALRRARRILPPYFAAYGIGLLLVLILPSASLVDKVTNGLWPPAFSVGSILTHLLLVHNWSPWIFAVDPPMWSIAVEWQIYFVFALALLPLWRRFGLLTSLSAALVLGPLAVVVISQFPWLAGTQPEISFACPWMLGCFGIGMAAATTLSLFTGTTLSLFTGTTLSLFERSKRRRPWTVLAWLLTALVLALHFQSTVSWLHDLGSVPAWLNDYVTAAAAAALILCLTHASAIGKKNAFLRLFETRPAMVLGSFSYSLYLVHMYALEAVASLFFRVPLRPVAHIFVFVVLGLPLAFALAYLFHLAFERPFMSKPAPKTERQAEDAAIVSPAP